MFLDTGRLPVARLLEREADCLDRQLELVAPDEFTPWVLPQAYRGCWRVFGIFHHGEPWVLGDEFRRHALDARFGAALAIVRRIPGIISAGFSRLDPDSHVFPHVDDQQIRTIRCLLGLRVGPGARMRVGGEIRDFAHHRCLAFDAGVIHDTVNEGVSARIAFGVELRLENAWDAIS